MWFGPSGVQVFRYETTGEELTHTDEIVELEVDYDQQLVEGRRSTEDEPQEHGPRTPHTRVNLERQMPTSRGTNRETARLDRVHEQVPAHGHP